MSTGPLIQDKKYVYITLNYRWFPKNDSLLCWKDDLSPISMILEMELKILRRAGKFSSIE